MKLHTHLTPSFHDLAGSPARRSTAVAATLVAGALLAGVGCSSPSTDAARASTTSSTTTTSKPAPPIVDQAALQTELDDLVALGVPGVVVMVRDDEQSVVLTSGVSDLDTGTPMSPDATFRIASLTKPYTASDDLRGARRHSSASWCLIAFR